MKLVNIHIQNFRSHANTRINFPDQGVTALVGANESGKSSVLEAVEWALFGAAALRGKVEGIHRRGSRHKAEVALNLRLKGQIVAIKRSAKDAKVSMGKSAQELQLVAHGTKPANAWIERALGMSRDEFAASYLCRQRDLGRLLAMTPAVRTTFIRRLLGVDAIDATLKVLRRESRDMTARVDGAVEMLPDEEALTAARDDAKDRLAMVTKDGKQAKMVRELCKKNLDLALKVRAKYEELAQELRRRKKHWDECMEHFLSINRKVESAKHSAERFDPDAKGRLEKAKRVSRILGHHSALEMEQRELRKATDVLDGLQYDAEEHEALEKRIADLKDAHAKVLRDHQVSASLYHNEVDERTEEIAEARQHLQDGRCPQCLRPYKDAGDMSKLSDRIDEMVAERDELREKGPPPAPTTPPELVDGDKQLWAHAEARDAHRRAENAVEVAKARVARVCDMAPDLPIVAWEGVTNEQKVEWMGMAKRFTEIEAAAQQADEHAAEAAKLEVLEEQYKDAKITYDAAGVHVDEAKRELAEKPNPTDEELRGYEEEYDGAHNRVSSLRDDYVRYKEQLAGAERQIADLQQSKRRIEELRAKAAISAKTAEETQTFRDKVATRILPELEELTSGFVGILTDDRHEVVRLDEGFTPTMMEGGEDSPVVSGGTEDVLALSMRLALGQLLAQRAGQPVELLVLDEPFGSLDEVRRGNVLSLLERLQTVYPQVVIISHIAETRDAADLVIELQHTPGGTVAT